MAFLLKSPTFHHTRIFINRFKSIRGIHAYASPTYPNFPRERKTIREVLREDISWYPGHINKGSREMNRRLAEVDFVIELHDARLPFTARTDLVSQFGQVRPFILILNKVDLADSFDEADLRCRLINPVDDTDPPSDVFFTKLDNPERQKRLLLSIISSINHVMTSTPTPSSCQKRAPLGMVAGIPNVGKSTLINAFRGLSRSVSWSSASTIRGRVKASRVGRVAGITRGVGQQICMWQDPPLFMLDTPGVLDQTSVSRRKGATPQEILETTLRLGVCGNLNMDSVNPEIFTDYLLYWWNINSQFSYVAQLGLPAPTHSVLDLLQAVCIKRRLLLPGYGGRGVVPDLKGAAMSILKQFSEGKFGRVTFDTTLRENHMRGFPFRVAESVRRKPSK